MRSNQELSIGDTVQLRAGGPMMTVSWVYDPMTDRPVMLEKISNDLIVSTIWFTTEGVERVNTFDVRTLVKR